MIRRVRLFMLLLTCVLLQTAVFPYLRIGGAVPDVGLVATIAVAYYVGPDDGAIYGFLAGIAIDLFRETPLGLSAIAFAATGYVVGVLRGGMLRSSRWVVPLLGGLGGLFGGLVFITIGALAGVEHLLTVHNLQIVVIAAAYDMVISPLIFPLARWATSEKAASGAFRTY